MAAEEVVLVALGMIVLWWLTKNAGSGRTEDAKKEEKNDYTYYRTPSL